MPMTLPPNSDLDMNPKTISLPTFHTLLSRYETTVRNLARRQALAKATKTTKKNSKAKTKRAVALDVDAQDEGTGQEDLSSDLKRRVEDQVEEFWGLDAWRYEGLRVVVGKRQNGKEGKGKGAYLNKEEVVRLMEWKLKHGVNRPTLLGLIKSNQDQVIQSATSSAFETLQSLSTPDTENNTTTTNKDPFYPLQKSLNALTTPLRGVGPATASLLLSAALPSPSPSPAPASTQDIPFYSDDVYLWLCLYTFPAPPPEVPILGDFESTAPEEEEKKKESKHKDVQNKKVRPNGELIVKYNIAEYRALWEAVGRLRERLNEDVRNGEGGVSCLDVERVALVVRHLELAGMVEKVEEEKEREDEGGEEDGDGLGYVIDRRKRRKVDDE